MSVVARAGLFYPLSRRSFGELTMTPPSRELPQMPEIGHPESYYAKRVHMADEAQDVHAHEAYKVGQYVTLAMDPNLSWDEKLNTSATP